jgi:protein TonB
VVLPQPKPKPEPVRKKPEPPKFKVQAKPVAPPQPKAAVLSEAAASAPAPAYVAPSQHATYLDNPKPAYPTVARKRGMGGRVVLRVQVRRDGTVSGVEVAQSTGYSVLDRAARSAVVHWRFAPATQGGVAVEGEVLVPFDFRLTAGE